VHRLLHVRRHHRFSRPLTRSLPFAVMSGNIQNIPLSVLLSWPTPNYDDPVRRTWMPLYAGILQAASTLTVLTRLWLRARGQAGPLGLDDVRTSKPLPQVRITILTSSQALLLPGWLGSIVFTAFSILSTEKYGNGTHAWDVPPTIYSRLSMCAWAAQVAFLIATGCTKCSILLFYRRLQKGTFNKVWLYCIYAALAFTVAWTIGFVLTLVFSCNPTEANWESANPLYRKKYSCVNARYENLISGTLSVVSDAYAVLLPCLMLRHFDVSKRQKVALNVIFCLGFIVVAAGSVRTYYFDHMWHTYDLTYAGFDVLIWAQLELQLSLICASAPALRVFFRRYLANPIRALSSGRSNIDSARDRDSRRTATRLTDDVPSLPTTERRPSTLLTPNSIKKFSNRATMSEIEFEMDESPSNSTLHRSNSPNSDGSEHPLKRDLEMSRPPAAYSLREKNSADDYDFGGTVPLYLYDR
jgi:hypothetical protein